MTGERERSGWLSWRFWLGSTLFWLVVGAVQGVLHHMILQQQPTRGWVVLTLTVWRFGPLILATPPLFELSWRLIRDRVSWRSYVARLSLVAFGCGFLHATLTGLLAGPATASPMALVVNMGMSLSPQYAAVLGCGIAVNQWRFAEARRRELLVVHLRALRAQLQPHFLFNTLHAIGVTAASDGPTAARMTTLLGDLLRQTVQERDGNLVSLAAEHELLQPYLALQQLRFADRLRFDIDLPADVLGAQVPDLLLQPLVENALQHGIERQPGVGTIAIRARRRGNQLELTIADDGPGLDDASASEGIGLGATRARLRALFGSSAELQITSGGMRGTVVTVRLPYREVSLAA